MILTDYENLIHKTNQDYQQHQFARNICTENMLKPRAKLPKKILLKLMQQDGKFQTASSFPGN